MILSVQAKNFTEVRRELTAAILHAPQVRTERWQGVDVSKNPAAVSYELRNTCFGVPLNGITDLQHWRDDTAANIPWADDHFLERVGGEPLNPGVQWANWPWAGSAAKFKTPGRFNHTYMERLWPKYARRTDDGTLPIAARTEWSSLRKYPAADNRPKFGIAHGWGDLEDLVELLADEPFTRQAFIPLFFPEDTGKSDGGRKVCTLGYQILVRYNADNVPEAHIWYPLRSCDLIRHFPDDCYLAVRLLLWIIEECAKRNPFWKDVVPGSYAMHMTSLHIFQNDMIALKRNADTLSTPQAV